MKAKMNNRWPRLRLGVVVLVATLAAGNGPCEPTPGDAGVDSDGDSGGDSGGDALCLDAACAGGATQACYKGPVGTKGVGACLAGQQTCTAGAWGACLGQVLPLAEVCDNQDNDCDKATDEGSACPCDHGVCRGLHCRAPGCDNGTKDGTETDLDCGGSCASFRRCAVGEGCGHAVDCAGLSCVAGKCAAPSCSDGQKNGAETDRDCGGGCPPCAATSLCVKDSDCAGVPCTQGFCHAPWTGAYAVLLRPNKERWLLNGGRHFASVYVTGGGVLVIRPRGLGQDAWGSSLFLQPFMAGSPLHGSQLKQVQVSSGAKPGVQLQAAGVVACGATGQWGTWQLDLLLTYDPKANAMAGEGSYKIKLNGTLASAKCSSGNDLNLFRISTNRLQGVYLLSTPGIKGNTGDMERVEISGSGLGKKTWTPSLTSTAYYPQDPNHQLSVDAQGALNQVDTARYAKPQGGGAQAPIAPAYKPSLKVQLTSADKTIPMIFGGSFDSAKATDPYADNASVHPLILAKSAATQFTFQVKVESRAHLCDYSRK